MRHLISAYTCVGWRPQQVHGVGGGVGGENFQGLRGDVAPEKMADGCLRVREDIAGGGALGKREGNSRLLRRRGVRGWNGGSGRTVRGVVSNDGNAMGGTVGVWSGVGVEGV